MQLKSGFFGSSSVFVQRSTPVRPRTRFAARAEKAASAGTWLPGVDSPSWLEEADLPANRGRHQANVWTVASRTNVSLCDGYARLSFLASSVNRTYVAGFDILNFGTDKGRLEW